MKNNINISMITHRQLNVVIYEQHFNTHNVHSVFIRNVQCLFTCVKFCYLLNKYNGHDKGGTSIGWFISDDNSMPIIRRQAKLGSIYTAISDMVLSERENRF